ncbi:sarcoplasmic/endoplasmic reticulum calcium ATPase 1-like protein, partial [Reticulomyxa filosa]
MEDSHFRTVQEVLEFFGTDPKNGLTSAQSKPIAKSNEEEEEEKKKKKNKKPNKMKQNKNGKNIELPPPPKTSWISLVIKQFQDMLVLILLGAAVISFVLSWLEEGKSYWETIVEPSVILLILICNAVVGVWQESSAEEAIE